MALDLSTEHVLYTQLRNHVGHDIHVVTYGSRETPVNVAIECYTCNCVLLSANRYSEDELEPCPKCGTGLENRNSGVICPKEGCGYWFCY
jgi:hypothetical protein